MCTAGFILEETEGESNPSSRINEGRIDLLPLPYISERSEATLVLATLKYREHFNGEKLHIP